MRRRDFVRLGCATVIGVGAGTSRSSLARSLALGHDSGPLRHPMGVMAVTPGRQVVGRTADFNLRIAPMMVALAPQVVISTIGYSNKVPGPLLRVRGGLAVSVEVVNDTDVPEYVLPISQRERTRAAPGFIQVFPFL